jgi:hypothetical protein
MREPASLPTAGPIERQPDPAVYQTDAIYPEAVSSLEAARSFRQRRVAVLAIYPVRVNPVRHELVIVRSIRLEIRFSQPATTVSRSAQPEISPADRALQTVLLNPQALQWAEAARVDLDRLSEMDRTLAAGTSYKVVVTESGLYSVTYSDLAAAGLPVDTLDPHTFRLTHGQPRQEVAVLVQGEADGQFGPGDRLLFYARPNFSRYTDEDIYFLSYAQGNGLRMATRSGVPTGLPGGNAWQTAEAEENHYYDSLYAGRDGDRWYWDQLRQPDKKSGTYSLSLPSGPKAGVAALLTIWLRGYTDPAAAPDHRVAVAVNGTGLGEKSWDGAQEIAETFTVPAGV